MQIDRLNSTRLQQRNDGAIAGEVLAGWLTDGQWCTLEESEPKAKHNNYNIEIYNQQSNIQLQICYA